MFKFTIPLKFINPGTIATATRRAMKSIGKVGSTGSSIASIEGAQAITNFFGTVAASGLLDRYTAGQGTKIAGLSALPAYINDPRLYDALSWGGQIPLSEAEMKAMVIALAANPSTDIVSEIFRDYVAGAAFALAFEDGALALGTILGDKLFEFEMSLKELLGEIFGDTEGINSDLSNRLQGLMDRPRPVDPLALDLDGDGIETVNSDRGIIFDHDGDGVKKGTGWIGGDDGLLVFDRNGDGIINDGGELFGEHTQRYNNPGSLNPGDQPGIIFTPIHTGGGGGGGGNSATVQPVDPNKCKNGFEALAQEDTNGDGFVNHLDSNWQNLKIWRDMNQDGVSQANELFTMEELGISGAKVDHTATNLYFLAA